MKNRILFLWIKFASMWRPGVPPWFGLTLLLILLALMIKMVAIL